MQCAYSTHAKCLQYNEPKTQQAKYALGTQASELASLRSNDLFLFHPLNPKPQSCKISRIVKKCPNGDNLNGGTGWFRCFLPVKDLTFLKSAKQKLYMSGTPSTLVESWTCKNCIKEWSYTTLLGNLCWYSPTSYISASRVARICLCLYLYLYIIVFAPLCQETFLGIPPLLI